MLPVGVRVDGDAGREAGMGHVTRSLALARLLQRRRPGLDVLFYLRDLPEGVAAVRKAGYTPVLLPGQPGPADYEAAFGRARHSVLVIDTLGSTDDVMAAARKHADRVVTLDDLTPAAAGADLVVNGILWATRELPERLGRAQVVQGVEYMPLREPFAKAHDRPREIRAAVRELVVSTGGADGRDMAFAFIDVLRDVSFPCRVRVMAGPAFLRVRDLREHARRASAGQVAFEVLEGVEAMWEVLLQADLALFTGGTVLFESAVCGTPAVIVCSYEHQLPQAQWFHDRGIAVSTGYAAGAVDAGRVRAEVERVAGDRALRQAMSDAGKRRVDGRGLLRLAALIEDDGAAGGGEQP